MGRHEIQVHAESPRRWTITLLLPVRFAPAQVQRPTKDQRDALRLEVGYDRRSRATRVSVLMIN